MNTKYTELEERINRNTKRVESELEPLPCPSCKSINTEFCFDNLIREVGIFFVCQDCKHKWEPLNG